MVPHHAQFAFISASKAFYLATFATLRYKEFTNFGNKHIALAANGKFTDLWLQEIGADGSSVKGVHLAFAAESRDVVDTFSQAAVYVMSSFEELTLDKLLTIFFAFRKAGTKEVATMVHQERGTTSQDAMQYFPSIRMVTTSRWFMFDR